MNEIKFLHTTIITAQEIWFGAQKKNFEKRLKTKKFLESIPILAYDKKSMEAVVEIKNTLQKTGAQIGPFDEIIAGICITENAVLLTRNIRHFDRIKRLKIETY